MPRIRKRNFIFSTAYGIFGLFYLPVFLTKIKQADDPKRLLRERWGILPETLRRKIAGKKVVWVHAVSVGEVMGLREFLKGFQERFPDRHIILSTVTATGQKIAAGLEGPSLSAVYFPFDFGFSCRRFFETLRPECLLLAETEIWPNLLLEAEQAGVPVGILNARLSEKSAAGYQKVKKIFAPLFGRLNFVLAQTEQDAARFEKLGVAREKIRVAGNMKLDQLAGSPDPAFGKELRKQWGFDPSQKVWMAGSTHPGEEELLLRAFGKLRKKFSDLRMILAPRHIERAEKLMRLAVKAGFSAERVSRRSGLREKEILILDQLGVLKDLYAFADAVFIGGSLVRKGGQNPVEPAVYRRGVLHGPYVFNFESIYQWLDLQSGGRRIADEKELAAAITALLENSGERDLFGENAFRAVEKLRGATARHLSFVERFLGGGSQERVNNGEVNAKLFPQIGGRV